MSRKVEQTGPNRFRVEGRSETHYDIELGAMTPCHCADAVWRDHDCIHQLAVRLFLERR